MALLNWFMDIKDTKTEQRRHVRVKALNLIRIGKDGGRRDDVVLNISDLSECGMGFRTQVKMDKDRVYPMVLHTPKRDVRGSIKVRWSEWVGGADQAYEVGVEFDSLSPDDTAFLRQLINAQ